MVEKAKNANFWTDGSFSVIFFPRYCQDLTKTLKQVWYGLLGYVAVETAKNVNFWTDGPFSVIFFSMLQEEPNYYTLRQVWYGSLEYGMVKMTKKLTSIYTVYLQSHFFPLLAGPNEDIETGLAGPN